jgi:ribosome maturation factor RimP
VGESPLFFCCEASAAAIMALSIEQIRHTADRVAASHGLEIVDIEYLGGSKHRVLRVFIEQNAERRASRALEASEQSLFEHLANEGIALDQLAWVTHEDCERFSRDLGNRHWLGKLSQVKPEGIVLDLTAKKQKGSKKGPAPVQTVEIAFSNIEKANLAPEI